MVAVAFIQINKEVQRRAPQCISPSTRTQTESQIFKSSQALSVTVPFQYCCTVQLSTIQLMANQPCGSKRNSDRSCLHQPTVQHPAFQQNLQRRLDSHSLFICLKENEQLLRIADDLSSLIFEQASQVLEQCCQGMKAGIQVIRQDLNKVKDMHLSQITKAEQFTKEISEDINFEDQQLFDLPSIIHSLQERVRQISLNSSAILDSSEPLRESRKEDAIQQRIGREIAKMEENQAMQQEYLEELVSKRIDKQQKTINSILETLNELHNPLIKAEKVEKTASLLSSSKSAAKLKTFFGFG